MSSKVRENRLRQAAQRQGLALRKSRRRDPRALSYGRWWLVGQDGTTVLGGDHGTTLDHVEEHLSGSREG